MKNFRWTNANALRSYYLEFNIVFEWKMVSSLKGFLKKKKKKKIGKLFVINEPKFRPIFN